MSHELELDREGRASFCYREKNGNPWHRLGNAMKEGFTLIEGLRAARMDRYAEKVPTYVLTPNGFVEDPDNWAVIWPTVDDPDEYAILANGLSSNYQIFQYPDVAETAMAIVGASQGDAVLDTLGLLFDGKRCFGFIDFGDVQVVLPNGAIDMHYKGLGFMSSHDATQSVTYYKTITRGVCNNTVTAGIARAGAVVRIRHTGDAAERLQGVREALDLAYGGDREFTELVQGLGMAPGGHDVLAKVIGRLWTKPEDEATSRAKSIWDTRSRKLHELYEAPSNEPAVGANAWAVYNTIAEWFDHHVGNDADRRARATITPGSGTDARKAQTLEVLANL